MVPVPTPPVNKVLIHTPTLSCIENKTYPLVALVIKLLRASHDELHASSLDFLLAGPIPTPPFHSAMETEIYRSFLEGFNAMVVKHWWWTSFLGGVAPSNVPALADLFHRVKAVMRLIHPTNELEGKRVIPTPLEITMIDILLYNTIKSSFETHHFCNYHLPWMDPPLLIEQGNNSIEMTWDVLKFKVTRDAIAQSTENYAKKVIENNQMIETLRKENDIIDLKLRDTKNEREAENAKLELRKTELIVVQRDLNKTTTKLEKAKKELEEEENENKLVQKAINELITSAKSALLISKRNPNEFFSHPPAAIFTHPSPENTEMNPIQGSAAMATEGGGETHHQYHQHFFQA